jgi:FAD/FMN-containing dehydrogenase
MNVVNDFAAVLGREHVTDDPARLARFGPQPWQAGLHTPALVVRPGNADELKSIIKLAAARGLPLVPRSSGFDPWGASVPSVPGSILIDLSRFDRVLAIDGPNKKVKVEPGVTWSTLQPALAQEGLMVCNPLLPHPAHSVVATALEREPILVPKSEYADVFMTAEMVLSDGEDFMTGTAAGKGMRGRNFPDGFIPGTRLFTGAQGTLGIVTAATLKAEWLPTLDKLFLLPFERLADLVEPLYALQRRMLGQECLVLDRTSLAALRGPTPADSAPFTILLCLSGFHRFGAEKVAAEEDALREIAGRLAFKVQEAPDGPALVKRLRSPAPQGPYWKWRARGASRELFFLCPLEEAPGLAGAVHDLAQVAGFPAGEIGFYLQPIERARVCHCEFNFPFDPADALQTALLGNLLPRLARLAFEGGALFSRPYGEWAGMVFGEAPDYLAAARLVKKALDPPGILNPGKLCLQEATHGN